MARNEGLPWVHLISQERYDREEIAAHIARIIEREAVPVADKSVFLKVSFVFPVRNPGRVQMIITNPHFIAGVSLALVRAGARQVLIADGETFGPARYAFDMVGMPQALKGLDRDVRRRIRFCYLDEVGKDWVTPPRPFCEGIRLDYPRVAREADLYISLPKLKVNIFADVTLSVKNGMGMICKKTRLAHHSDDLHEMIADIHQVRPPDYIITDAVFAGEAQGPMEAASHAMGLIIFGSNGPAVDSTCCRLMGVEPRKVRHLRLLADAGYGPLEAKKIRLENGGLMKSHQRNFVRADDSLDSLSPRLHCHAGACESGCRPFMRAILDGYGKNRGWESLGDLTVITGKDVELTPEQIAALKGKRRRTIIYGDCVKQYRHLGVFYPGCPPDYIQALLTLPLRTDLGFTPWIGYVDKLALIKSHVAHGLATLFGLRKR